MLIMNETTRAAEKVAEQFQKIGLAIHKIVSQAISLGCTETRSIQVETLLQQLVQVCGDSKQKWKNRLAQAFSDEGNAYGQYFIKCNNAIVFHPSVWLELVRCGWSQMKDPEIKLAPKPSRRNSLQVGAWGAFQLEVIGSSTPYKEPDFFRADVGIERLQDAVQAGATFIFVYVNNGTRAFSIPAHTLLEACRSHNVSVNTNGTHRYSLYINHVQGVICKNTGPDGFIASFDNSVNA